MGNFRTISIDTDARDKEGIASGAITPGHLLERTSTADTVKVHATAGAKAQRLFAIEDEHQGKEISDAYSSADRVFFKTFQPGDRVHALIANGEAIAIGDWLVSNGDGTLKEADADSSGTIFEQDVIGVAMEACDMSDSSGADPSPRCVVEVR